MKRNKCSLLPFVREDIYGLTPQDAQITGWEIEQFHIKKQWKHSKGENILVGVVDTGCDFNHPDIKNNIVQGINLVSPNSDPMDDNGHGTHVSGTIAGEDNSLGMVGVSPRTKIMPIKVLGHDGSGNFTSVAKGIIWAADHGCHFITMSLGSASGDRGIHKAIQYATEKNCIVFCAAGNDGPDSPIMFPASYPETIAIGAVDRNLQRTDFTCSGDELDFLSPGDKIVSCTPQNSYASMSGTSMATPFAVGCACLYASYAKKIQYSSLDSSCTTPEDYRNLFKRTSKSLENPMYRGIKKYEGYGIMYPAL